MKAVLLKDFGTAENLFIGKIERPKPKPKEILVKVRATALNRADIMQREGKYPPPAGASSVLGLEIAGEVAEIGEETSLWQIGDKVCGLIPGGGYAEYAVVHEQLAMTIPSNINFEEAAGIPEVFLTAYQNLVWNLALQKSESVLIHAGASGVGTVAIQLAKLMGLQVITTSSSSKTQVCKNMGADLAIDYQNSDFLSEVLRFTENKGVNGIIDFMAASYLHKNIDALALDGRMVMLALMGGTMLENLNLIKIFSKRLTIKGSTLRSRSLDYQIKLMQEFKNYAFEKFENKALKPIIDTVFDWQDVQKAHVYMESNQNIGKIILKIS